MTNDDGRAVAEVAVARTRPHLDPVFYLNTPISSLMQLLQLLLNDFNGLRGSVGSVGSGERGPTV
jgi:hypothetical protein